jgi:hypothetical protein
MVRFALVLLLLSAWTLSCAVTGGSPAPSTGTGILFQDDFSDHGSGWDQASFETGVTDYEDGVYRIYVNEPNVDYWANPGLDFTDVRVEVEATKVGGSDDNDLGIICRYQDAQNFYFAVISSDGFAGIVKSEGGEQTPISSEALEPADAVREGNSTNTLRFDCVGDSLSLMVNGTQVAAATDAAWAKGDVGLVAGTFDTPGTDVHFDNFVVREP